MLSRVASAPNTISLLNSLSELLTCHLLTLIGKQIQLSSGKLNLATEHEMQDKRNEDKWNRDYKGHNTCDQ